MIKERDAFRFGIYNAGFLYIRNIEITEKWLELCKNKHLIDDSPSISSNLEGFYENRHDQSLLSLLAKIKK